MTGAAAAANGGRHVETIRFLERCSKELEAVLDDFLPKETEEPAEIQRAMRYSVFAGGKRVRPALAIGACEAVGGSSRDASGAAAALECIHTYSLIHDDLPAMDDDDFRRGKPTSHKVFGEAVAILAGDGLLTYAFEVLARAYADRPALAAALVLDLAGAAGVRGMVGGQVIDIRTDGPRTEAALENLHRMKTGALITASCVLGGRAGGASPDDLAALRRFGEEVGLAFQIADDVLDATQPTEKLGKTAGKDREQNKLTYVALHGVDEARRLARARARAARDAVARFGARGQPLADLATFIVERDR